jgi:hypothetical protein
MTDSPRIQHCRARSERESLDAAWAALARDGVEALNYVAGTGEVSHI